jgi:RNA polymerase-binding transcription factor DksA
MSFYGWKAEESKLFQARKEVLDELDQLQQEIESEIDFDVEEADEQITEHETAAILINMLENKVENIEAALVAIEMGRYEYCEQCGEAIEPERLQAKPDARLCIACQQAAEKQ